MPGVIYMLLQGVLATLAGVLFTLRFDRKKCYDTTRPVKNVVLVCSFFSVVFSTDLCAVTSKYNFIVHDKNMLNKRDGFLLLIQSYTIGYMSIRTTSSLV